MPVPVTVSSAPAADGVTVPATVSCPRELPEESLNIMEVIVGTGPPVCCQSTVTVPEVAEPEADWTATFSCPAVPPPVIDAIVPEVNM